MTDLPAIADRRRAPALALVALSGITQAVAAGAAAWATRDVFSALHASGAFPVASLALLFGAGATIALLRIAERVLGEWIGQHYSAALRRVMFQHLGRISPRELANRRSGSLALRFVGDLATVRTWVSLGIARIISAMFVLPGAIAAMWLLNPNLGVSATIILITTLALMAFAQKFLAPLHRKLRKLRARIAVDMSERAPVAAELRLQGRQDLEDRKLEKSALRLRRAAVKRTAAASGLKAVPEVAVAAAGVVIMALAFRLELTAADTAAALALLGILAVPVGQLAVIWDRHRAWQVARHKCQVLLEVPELPDQPSTGNAQAGGVLRLDAVSDQHIRSVTGEIRYGESVAVIGPNGAGKSSLLALIAGLDSPASGRITLGGQPVKPDQVCYVGPRSPVLRGSLRRAFTMGVENRPGDAEITAVAKSLGLAPLLERLGGLDGRVAEAGRNLSSGELCRLHLVRAALCNADILLLDEPEEALDPDGRVLIERLISEARTTTIFVTHDLALARLADQLWFVADGELRAQGAPDALLSQPGPVREFARPQLAG